MSATLAKKILNACLLLSSFAGFLEWGQGNRAFLVEAEVELFSRLTTDPSGFLHPFILLPLLGQVLLLVTLFQKKPGWILTLCGMACIGILLLFVFVIGIMAANFKVMASTLPFICTAVLVIREYRKKA